MKRPIKDTTRDECCFLGKYIKKQKIKCSSKGHGRHKVYKCEHSDLRRESGKSALCIPTYLGPWGRNQEQESLAFLLCKRCTLKESVKPPSSAE